MFRFALYLQGMADGLGCALYGLVQDWIGRRGTSWLFPFRSVSDMAWQTWQVQLRYVLECIGQDMADRSGFVGQVIGYDLAWQTRWVG